MYGGRDRGPPPPPPPRGPPRDMGGGRDYPRGGGDGDHMRSPREFRGEFRGDVERRRRSPSPPMHERERDRPDRYPRARSPPPPYKRPRREEYYDGPPPYGRGSPDYRRPPSPHDGEWAREPHDGRGRAGSVGRDRVEEEKRPMSFKEFMLRKVPDDAAPDVAHRLYQEYLVEYYGSAIKAEFEQNKDNEFFKAQFDPRTFFKIVASRCEEAQDSAKHIITDLQAGNLDPANESFNQGMYDLAPKVDKEKVAANPEEAPKFAPILTWKPSRVAHDLDLSRRLIRKLDAEKSITDNPLLPKLAAQPTAEPAGDGAGDGTGDGAQGDGEQPGDEPPAPAVAPAAAPPADEPTAEVDENNLQEMMGKLDLQLHWLWKVHGVDYYAGIELNEHDWPYRLNSCRLIRGPAPEEGEQDASAGRSDQEHLGKVVDDCWTQRIAQGDPLEAKCPKARIDEELDKWIESQVTMVGENKWGSKLSNKLFVGRKYVVKHIKTKHQDKLLTEKEKVLDMLYFENFRIFREKEERRRVDQEQHANGEPMEEDGAAEAEGPAGGRGRGRGPMGMRGRGRGMMGRGMMGRGPMMGMEGPIIMPLGMPPMAPMAFMQPGPMGPFMPILPGPMPMMPPGPIPLGRGRGPRPLRGMPGRGMPGRGIAPGTKLDGRGFREYFDLDNPANNRAVLDYGDL